jgi:hypothetical protein
MFKSIPLLDHPLSFTIQPGHPSLLAKFVGFTPEQSSVGYQKV